MVKEQLEVPRCVLEALEAMGVEPAATVGVALSGGADSVALLLALRELGMMCVALHCNFGLRGQESEDDEMFVRGLCDSIGVPLEVVRFDVPARRAMTGESVEMACRSLRYDWFAAKARELRLDYVAVGHHLEDDVETFLLNLLRGSGLPGLAGMAPRRGLYIRPMLRCSRGDIEAYLRGKHARFVTDSSNLSDCYGRNRLRLHVLPELVKTEPDALERVGRSLDFMHDDLELFNSLLEQRRAAFIAPDGAVDMTAVAAEPCAEHLLFRLLLPLYPGLDARQAANVVEATRRGESGKIFDIGKCRMLLDRGRLVRLDDDGQIGPLEISPSDPSGWPSWLTVRTIPRAGFAPRRDASRLWIDAAVVTEGWRLILRPPREGDRLAPFGMKGTRLLSDIFRDAKYSANSKRRAMVLTAVHPADGSERILWVVGLRASRYFPVTERTEHVLEFTAMPDPIP